MTDFKVTEAMVEAAIRGHLSNDEYMYDMRAAITAAIEASGLVERVAELEAKNARLRGYIEGMIPEMEKFNQRGCGRNCYMEGDWFDVSEARTALTSKGEG